MSSYDVFAVCRYAEDREQDLEMILCNTCERWVHSKCTGIDADVYQYVHYRS